MRRENYFYSSAPDISLCQYSSTEAQQAKIVNIEILLKIHKCKSVVSNSSELTESDIYLRFVSVNICEGKGITNCWMKNSKHKREYREIQKLASFNKTCILCLINVDKCLTLCLNFFAVLFPVSSNGFLDICRAGTCLLSY